MCFVVDGFHLAQEECFKKILQLYTKILFWIPKLIVTSLC